MDVKSRNSKYLNLSALMLSAGALLSAPVFATATTVSGNAGLCQRAAYAETLLPATRTASDARAYWLSRNLLAWPGSQPDQRFVLYASATASLKAQAGNRVSGFQQRFTVLNDEGAMSSSVNARFAFLGPLHPLRIAATDRVLKKLMTQQLLLVQEDGDGKVIDSTLIQSAGSLDDLYAEAADKGWLGVRLKRRAQPQTAFHLWAPTAQRVQLCLYPDHQRDAVRLLNLKPDAQTGIWQQQLPADLNGYYYQYLVDVMVPGVGLVRQKVSDPYSVSLNTDSIRSYIADLDDAQLKPDGWDQHSSPASVQSATDLSIYELHVRDFSANDASVPPAHRGKYLAFTDQQSLGMRHLQQLAQAGITDIHLLPVFDFATVPEHGCVTPAIKPAIGDSSAASSSAQQAAVMAAANKDCYNWGYDPLHYNAPEGSYASDPADGATRIREFRQMVLALHRAGLRVGMDVVFNHTAFAGQHPQSVLDRIVPGYYQRLDNNGKVADSTCQPCGNTATENRMMAKLVRDSVRQWASAYRIDSFRFDLMGHQPRALMEQLRSELQEDQHRPIYLIGEGWNFGEVADNKRFVQASQLSLNGSHIGTFSDRARDAIRGGGFGDTPDSIRIRQGLINGAIDAPNEAASQPVDAATVARAMDIVRAGLAGTLRDYRLQTADGTVRPLSDIDYNGQAAGYASQPDEVVNYVENHDNQTLFDINALRLPASTSHEDRARAQLLGLALTAFSQGIAYFHAGSEILRSKSFDGNSYNSGDWFNRIDWSLQDNYFGSGLPPADNERYWPLMRPLLDNPQINPRPQDIAWAWHSFLDLMRIRRSSQLFHLTDSTDVNQRLHFMNTGPHQLPGVIVMHLNGEHLPGACFRSLLVIFNLNARDSTLSLPELRGRHFTLHPVHLTTHEGDTRIVRESHLDETQMQVTVPERSVTVFTEEGSP